MIASVDESTAREQRAKAIAREIVTHRRAINVHKAAIAKFIDVGQVERAEAVRKRLGHARELLIVAIGQQRDLVGGGYAAMGIESRPDAIVHAVVDGHRASACGLETAAMVGIADNFASIPPERRCPDCTSSIERES